MEYILPTITVIVFIAGIIYIVLKDNLSKVFVNKNMCNDHLVVMELKLNNLTEVFHEFRDDVKTDMTIIKSKVDKLLFKKGE